MRLFFNRRKEEPDQQPELDLPSAILKNKDAIGTLEKRHAHIEKKIQVQESEARSRLRAGDKRGAMLALRRKKMYDGEVEQLENSRLTLEQQILTLEAAQTQQVAVGALATGVVAQKQINQQMNLGKIDKLMEDMQEQSDQQKEVAHVLTQAAPIMDDDELLAELEQLEQLELDNQLAAASTVPTQPFPSGPVGGGPSALVHLNTSSGGRTASSFTASASPPTIAPSQPPRGLTDEEQLKVLMGELA